MKHLKLIYNLIFFSLLVLVLSSCEKILDVKPKYIRTAAEVYRNDAATDSVVTGLYYTLVKNGYNITIPLVTGLSSDDLKPTEFGTNVENSGLFQNLMTSESSTSTEIWTDSYAAIYVANSIIDGAAASQGMTTAGKQKSIGEARFIRAFTYFYLVNFFGDVPLITSTNYQQSQGTARTAAKEVYAQMIADLVYAETNLPDNYPTADRARASKWVAKALLARVYLFNGDWTNAKLEANAVIANTAQYQLGEIKGTGADDAECAIFHSDSKETIWQFWNEAGTSQAFFSSGDFRNFDITSDGTTALLAAFETDDKRKFTYINDTDGSGTVYQPYKYRYTGSEDVNYKEYTIVFRLAEQYLIRAEAKARLGETDAIADVNVIRNRAGLPSLTGITDQQQLINVIVQERRVELCFEWADRWLNLRRLGTLDQVMMQAKPATWKSTAALYPIPRAELTNNPLLKQNPGYN